MKKKTCQELWKEYAFLTTEMRKFVSVPDWPTLESLQRQREEVQELLMQQKEDDFPNTKEGQILLQQLLQDQKLLVQAIDVLKRNMRQQHENASAYQGISGIAIHLERKG